MPAAMTRRWRILGERVDMPYDLRMPARLVASTPLRVAVLAFVVCGTWLVGPSFGGPSLAFADFCSGKQNGLWCDGAKLVTCKSNKVSSSQNCPDGCQSMPAGTADKCKAATNFCTGKASGKWCDGSKLVTCSGGSIASSSDCPDGCQSNAAGTDDQCKSAASTGFCTGKQSGLWCDGASLVNCQGGVQTTKTACANGCESMPVGVADQCKSGGSSSGKLELCQPFEPAKSVTCGFGCYDGHKGSDYAAADGTPIYAPTSGNVVKVVNTYAGQTCAPDFGNYVKIATGSYEILLAHMRKDILVGEGPITAGKPIGYVSNTGYTLTQKNGAWVCQQGGGHHLHLEVRKNGVAFDAASSGDVAWMSCNAIGGGTVVPVGFCAGKQNGAWCDGSDVVMCKDGAKTGSTSCPAGCQSNPDGVADACKVGPSGPCVGKANGAFCDGDTLRVCIDAKEVETIPCVDGCGDVAGVKACKPPAKIDDCAGKGDGGACNGDVLLQCAGGKTASATPCALGCSVIDGKAMCSAVKPGPADPCASLANGGHCEAATLRICTAATTTAIVACTNGCGGAAGVAGCLDAAGVGFCAAKADGWWCDGKARVHCVGHKHVEKQSCGYGCGVADAAAGAGCLGLEAASCAAQGDGVVCVQGMLLGCAGGLVQSATLCMQGCVAGAGVPGAAAAATCKGDVGFCSDKVDGAWCSGGHLVYCHAQGVVVSEACKYGCFSNLGPAGGSCGSAAAGFCDGRPDGAHCDGNWRVICVGGAEVQRNACAAGCSAVAGAATCADGSKVACSALGDGVHCVGPSLVQCAGGGLASSSACVNGCANSVDGGAACVVASAADSTVGVVVDVDGCATWVGNLAALDVSAQDQTAFSDKLGKCTDHTIAEHGALITTLSTVYAAMGAPRDAFGVSANTPAIENLWRRENDGYLACDGAAACCARWDRNPGDIDFDVVTGIDGVCIAPQVALRVVSALLAKRPVIVGIHRIGNVVGEHYVTVVGVSEGQLLVLDPKGGLGPVPLSKLGAVEFVVDFVALPRLDGAGLHGIDGAGVGPGGLPGGPGLKGVGGANGAGGDPDAHSIDGGDGGSAADSGAWVPSSSSSGCSAAAPGAPANTGQHAVTALLFALAMALIALLRAHPKLARTERATYTLGPGGRDV